MRPSSVLVAVVTVAVMLSGCLAGSGGSDVGVGPTDDGPDLPEFSLPDEITGFDPVGTVELGAGSGTWIRDGYAFVGGQDQGLYVVDARHPDAAKEVAQVPNATARDVDLLDVGDRTIAATAAGGPTMHFVDVTEPTRPEHLTSLDVGQSVHNLAVVPNTTLVYNSRSLGDAVEPGIDIVDASDPSDPEVVTRWTFPPVAAGQPVETTGCHDITVYPDADRAYCAGVTQTYVMDIEDPTDPTVEGVVTNPAINIHHFAVPAEGHGHDLLLIGDEYGGTLAPACFGYRDTPAGPASTPTGALWFYDISDPANPVLLGYLSAPQPSEGPAALPCTAHFGDQVPGRDLFALGWYTAGVLLIDFSDPMQPTIVDQALEDRNVWDVRYWNAHLVTGNIGHGSDVLRLAGS